MKIIKRNNQKALMFLFQTNETGGLSYFKASIVLISHDGDQVVEQHTTETKILTNEQLSYILEHISDLEKRGIYVIDTTNASDFTNDSSFSSEPIFYISDQTRLKGQQISTPIFIESPYIFIFNDLKFFSTQKTRGPNL